MPFLPLMLLTACNDLPDVGATVVLKERGMAALSPDDLRDMHARIANEDMTGLQEMVNAGKVILLQAGTTATLTEKSLDRATIETVLDGHKQKLWIESELLESAGQ